MPTIKGVTENIIASLAVLGLVAAASFAAAKLGAAVALWAVVPIAAGAAAVGVLIGWNVQDRADLPRYQADLLGEAMLALRDFASGRLDVPFADLIERGILGPARFGLSLAPDEEIRLSVIELDDSEGAFRMVYESGHSLGRKDDFSLSRASLAGHAFDSKELQWTDDVDGDRRWQPHPKADRTRHYKSLAAMPVVVGDEAVAVLNVLSTEPRAFLKGDLTYIELLGALLALAWNIEELAADASNSLAIESSEAGKGGT